MPYRRLSIISLISFISINAATVTQCTVSAKADPATAMVVIGIAESVISLFNRGPDLTQDALKQQTIILNGVHARLSASERGIEVLLKYVSVLPSELKLQLENNRDVNRSEILAGFIEQIQGISEDLSAATILEKKDSIGRLQSRMDFALLNMQPERTALLKRSNFVIPTIAVSLIAELNARRMIPQDGAEITRALAAYDKKFFQALDMRNPDSLIYMRTQLEEVQKSKKFEITQIMTGAPGEFPAGEVEWFSHTLQGTRLERRTRHVRPPPGPHRIDGNNGYDVDYDAPVTYDIHSRSWKRAIRQSTIPGAADLEDFTIEVVNVGPNETNVIVGSAAKHSTADDEYELAEKARTSLDGQVREYNARAYAINSLKGLEQIAVQARSLIARWDENQAAKIVGLSEAFQDGIVASRMDSIWETIKDQEIQDTISTITKTRLEVLGQLDKAADEFAESVRSAQSKKWLADIGMLLQVLKISIQIQQLNDRLETVSRIANFSLEVQNNILFQNNIFIRSAPAQSETALPNDIYISSLTEQDKAELIVNTIRYAEKQPAPDWNNLPSGATLIESKLAFAIIVLNSMGHTYADKEVEAYRAKIKELTFSMKLKNILLATLLPTPTGGSTLVDAPAQAEYRRRINDLLRPYALRRFGESPTLQSQSPR